MRIVSLCSSSKANCTYIEHNGEGVLVDAGCSFKALRDGLRMIDKTIDDVRAVFVTHEHSDHIAGLMQLTKNTDIPVFASEGTIHRLVSENKLFTDKNLHTTDDISRAPVNFAPTAFHTPHDSAESMGYTFSADGLKIAVCTDIGHITEEVRANLLGCRFVLLESNYDLTMLTRNIKYSPQLKQRIRSDRGHLSNSDSGVFARELIKSGTTSIMLGHLSQENNTPEIAYDSMISALSAIGAQAGRDFLLDIAQVRGTGKMIIV